MIKLIYQRSFQWSRSLWKRGGEGRQPGTWAKGFCTLTNRESSAQQNQVTWVICVSWADSRACIQIRNEVKKITLDEVLFPKKLFKEIAPMVMKSPPEMVGERSVHGLRETKRQEAGRGWNPGGTNQGSELKELLQQDQEMFNSFETVWTLSKANP